MDNLAKNFILQLASLITLFVSIPAFITLVFGVINLVFPDAAESYWRIDNAREGIRISIAILVIFFPAYLLTTRIVNKSRRTEGTIYHTLTKWLIYIALLVAGIIMLIDLAVVVMTFLNGEITIRFILKALAVLAVIGSAFYYYLEDAKNYWQNREKTSMQIGAVALLVVATVTVFAFTKIETPQEVRSAKLDSEQVSDLQAIQSRIEVYYQENSMLPGTIAEAYPTSNIPVAPGDRKAYEYKVIDDSSYELCAYFATESSNPDERIATPVIDKRSALEVSNYNWEHGIGDKCFKRTIVEVTP